MKAIRWLPILIAVLMTTTQCGGPVPVTSQGSPQPAMTPAEPADGLNALVNLKGEVRLKRAGWKEFYKTDFGTLLNWGDQLLVRSDASASVLCSSLILWPVPAGTQAGLANGCPRAEPVIRRYDSAMSGIRGPADPLAPFVITPRGAVLSPRPLLRWNPVGPGGAYTVRVTGADVAWEQTTRQDHLAYPGSPPLAPGGRYRLVVIAPDGSSSQDGDPVGGGFTMMDAATAEAVNAAARKIEALGVPTEGHDYAVAQLYLSRGLYADAIALLETLVSRGSAQAAVYRSLGDAYRLSGVLLPALEPYRRAVELSKAAGDIEGEAAALRSLGECAAGLGNAGDAKNWLGQSAQRYRDLGDDAAAAEIDAALEKIH